MTDVSKMRMKMLSRPIPFVVALLGLSTAGICLALPSSNFGPIYPTISNPCATTVRAGVQGRVAEGNVGEMVHFTINGKVVPVLENGPGASRLKFTIDAHGEGMGATTGAKYVFDTHLETTANTGGKNAAADANLKFDEVYKLTSRLHSAEGADAPGAAVPSQATIEFPLKVSYADGATVAWFVNAQENIRLTCQATP